MWRGPLFPEVLEEIDEMIRGAPRIEHDLPRPKGVITGDTVARTPDGMVPFAHSELVLGFEVKGVAIFRQQAEGTLCPVKPGLEMQG